MRNVNGYSLLLFRQLGTVRYNTISTGNVNTHQQPLHRPSGLTHMLVFSGTMITIVVMLGESRSIIMHLLKNNNFWERTHYCTVHYKLFQNITQQTINKTHLTEKLSDPQEILQLIRRCTTVGYGISIGLFWNKLWPFLETAWRKYFTW